MTKLDSAYEYSLGYIVHRLPEIPKLPPKLTLGGRNYIAKPELHCSLVAIKKLAPQLVVRDHLSPEAAEQRALEVAIAAVNRVKPQFAGLLNDIRLADQPERDRHTIIVMAHVSGLNEVFAEINHELGLEQPTQPAHITLYQAENGLPIGITNPSEEAQWTRPLDEATRSELTAQLDPYRTFSWSIYMCPKPMNNNLVLEFHVPGFAPAREFYAKFGFTEIDYDPISGGGKSDLGYLELKREDALGRTQLNFYGDKDAVAKHARFKEFPADTPRGYGVEVTIPVTDVTGLWERVGRHLPKAGISQPLEIKRWGKLDFRVVDPFGFYIRFTEIVDWRQDR